MSIRAQPKRPTRYAARREAMAATIRSIPWSRRARGQPKLEQVVEDSKAIIPIGRYGRPDEFGAAAAFLASAQAGYITGSLLRVDGGMIHSI